MAEERVSDIVVPVRVELQDEGLKKIDKKLDALGNAKGIAKISQAFDSVSKTFKKTKNIYTQTDEAIVNQLNKTSKSLEKAEKQWGKYAKARDALSAARRKGAPSDTLIDLGGKKQNAWDLYSKYVGEARADYKNLNRKEDKYRIDQANKLADEALAKEVKQWEEREALIKENAQKQIDAEKQVEAEREQVREKNRKGYISWWEDQLNAQDEATKRQIEAEKQAAEAAKQAAKEQEEAKERVRKAWQDFGNALKKPVENFRKGVRTLASTLYVLRRFVSFSKSMAKEVNDLIQASSSWIENLNLLEVVFGDVSENAEKTKKSVAELSERFSMDKNAIVQFMSTFKQMANAMGQAAATGEYMSQVLVQLGLDISSLRNVKTETAMSDLASAIAGQIKPVRKYGFDVSLQSINAMLKESGIGGTVTQLSQADKQLARTILLIQQSRDAWGDLGKTINTFANQQRIMNDQFETTKRLLGQIFIGTFQFGDSLDEAKQTAGIATKAIWYINGALIAFNQILEAILPSADSVNGALAAGADEAADAYEDLEEQMEGSLASFDKFNVMSKGSGGALGSNTTLAGLFGKEAARYIEDFTARSKKIASYAREISNELLGKLFPEYKDFHDKYMSDNNGDDVGAFSAWVKSSTTAQEALKKFVEPITKIKETLEEAFSKIDIVKVLNAVAQIILAIVKILIGLGNAIVKISNGLGENGIVGLLKAIVITLIAIKSIQIITGAINGISTISNALSIKFAPALTEISNNIKLLKTDIGDLGGVTLKTSAQMEKSLQQVSSAVMSLVAGFASLSVGVLTYLSFRDQMTTASKAIVWAVAAVVGAVVGLITAIATLASGANIAVGVLKGLGAAAAITGITLSVGSAIAAMAHAQGGYQTGGLFNAGENGPEWVGRQGNTSTIVNDKQMSDIMQQSVAMGVVQGNRMSNAGRTAGGDGKVAVVNLDGKKLFEVVEYNGKKVGKVFAEA